MITKTRSVPYTINVGGNHVIVKKATAWSAPPTLTESDTLLSSVYGTTQLTESITYGIGAPDNYCLHTRTRRYFSEGTAKGRTWNNSYPTKQWDHIITNVTHFDWSASGIPGTDLGLPAIPAFVTPTWEHFSARAVQVMWPSVESSLSLPNALLELREVKHMPRQVLNLLKRVFRDVGDPGKSLSWAFKRLGRQTRQVGESILISEFGIRPLVSDIRALHGLLRDAEAEAQLLLANSDKQLKSHAKFWVDMPSMTTHTSDAIFSTERTDRRTRTVEWKNSWYHATMYYSYDLDDFTRQHLTKLVALDKAGILLNPQIIWDALPWSFVVDWLVKVGDFLDQFALRNVRPNVKVHRFCHSYKGTRLITRYYTVCHNREPRNLSVMGSEEQSYYLRKPAIPDFYSALQSSGISTRKVVLAGALAATR